MLERSRIYEVLREVGAVDARSIELYADRVRDRDDVAVYRCTRSGVIFLGRTDHVQMQHYVEKDLTDWKFAVGDRSETFVELDNARRQADQFRGEIAGKTWLDFGCGGAALLEVLGPEANGAWGLEPTKWYADPARARGLNIVSSLDELGDQTFDIITLFHVFEHLTDPVMIAKQLRSRLRPGGKLLIEVPHARDFLLGTLDIEAFRKFTLWSEHLVLHTRGSLSLVLQKAGFERIDVRGVQRFPLSNHLYWLRYGEPGGHVKWASIDDPALTAAYETTLNRLDATDSIVALAS